MQFIGKPLRLASSRFSRQFCDAIALPDPELLDQPAGWIVLFGSSTAALASAAGS
jgi:hypothetical protein